MSVTFQNPLIDADLTKYSRKEALLYELLYTAQNTLLGKSAISGTSGTLPKFNGHNTLANSRISESGSVVTVDGQIAVNDFFYGKGTTFGRDSRNNSFIKYDNSTVYSNRLLTIGNPTYTNVVFDAQGIKIGDLTNSFISRVYGKGVGNTAATAVARFDNLAGLILMCVKDSGTLNLPNIPTSPAGLVAGDVWRSGNDLKIV